ncbi:MAG: hypothetical protein JWQ09_3753, partial [Segetibacter sp.]|nr:hypothetical protein [Segetibacter sp.]
DKSIAHFPARILGFSITGLSVLMFSLLFTAGERSALILFFATILLVIGAAILWMVRKPLVKPVAIVEEKRVTVES